MKISFDTTEDIEHLKELHALIARLIEKKGTTMVASPQSLPQEGMFAMFGQEQTESLNIEQQKQVDNFRVIEY